MAEGYPTLGGGVHYGWFAFVVVSMFSDEDIRLLARTQGAFRIRPVGREEVWNVRWRKDPTKPTYRYGGTTGWVDYIGEIHRVHVCSFVPCTKAHAVSKQKSGLSASVHVHRGGGADYRRRC
mgnify:CR=1 FL=1